jgi:hypothetical protein
MSPACPCDMIAMLGSQVFRVEVKSAYRKMDGRVQVVRHHKPDGFDAMAFVLPDGQIVYEPDFLSSAKAADAAFLGG